jgi:predicted AlkP superfamily phosphohydrolase/phosphomutase
MTARSIWIEIDSLHSNVLLQAIGEGLMPNIARVLQEGGATRVTYEVPLQVAAWASAHTGLSVNEHCALAYDRIIPRTYRMRIDTQPVPPGTAYWDLIGKIGKRVLVINSVNPIMPISINGIRLTDWSVHVAGRHNKPTSHPPELAASLEREFPDPFAEGDCGNSNFVDAERLVNAIKTNLERKSRVFSRLIDRESWDHVHIGLDDMHNLGHMLWDCFDQTNPDNGLVREALRETDIAIGRFLDCAGPNAIVMVLVLGGIGPANTWSHMVDKIISHIEGGGTSQRNAYGRLGRVWNLQPPWLASRILPLKSYVRELYLCNIRRRRRAFAMPLNEESGAIRINLRGREPDGIVEPGEEYRTLAEELRDSFLELRDIESGLPLVSKVLFARDLVSDAVNNPEIPDLFIEWNRTRRMNAVQSERLGCIEIDFFPARSGDHHVDGFVLSNRPITPAGNDRDAVSVLDLAPTIASLHGVEPPDRWRGCAFMRPAPGS